MVAYEEVIMLVIEHHQDINRLKEKWVEHLEVHRSKWG